MASGIFAVLDDVAALLDDAATMSKVAAKKTAGILGDDLAVNAQKASNFAASRELPVLWAITKGSFLNKLIIVPLALLLSSFFPAIITPILLLGGAYLAFEGMEKIFEWIFHSHSEHKVKKNLSEAQKIRSAITTDFILSIEIVVIALSSVGEETLFVRIVAVSITAIAATIGVYGIVALIVRMDDFGFYLQSVAKKRANRMLGRIGEFFVAALPKVIRALSVIGTFAMLLVAGGIYLHNIESLHHYAVDIMLLSELVIGAVLGSVIYALERAYRAVRS